MVAVVSLTVRKTRGKGGRSIALASIPTDQRPLSAPMAVLGCAGAARSSVADGQNAANVSPRGYRCVLLARRR